MAKPVLIEFDEYITPDGVVYELHDGVSRFLMGGIDGQGMPDIEYRTLRGPYQHGESVVDYVLRPRTLQFVHRRIGRSRQDYWDIRRDILNIFRPNRAGSDPGVLRKIFPDGSKVDLAVRVNSSPKFRNTEPTRWDAWTVQEGIRLIAHDPTFYDPDEVEVILAYGGLFDDLIFPITFPITFSGSYLDDTENVVYPGTWLAYPTIEITGPINNPIIENQTTGEEIELTYNIGAGSVVTIDLRYGVKTVQDTTDPDPENWVNLLGVVTTASDLGTFHIQPEPEAANGVNVIRARGSGVTQDTQIVLRYFTRYIGI